MSGAIDSRAFQSALLRTERIRILGVIAVIVAFGVTGAVRIYLFGSHMTHFGIYAALVFTLYEIAVLAAVHRAVRETWTIPDWFWTFNVIVEMSMPALGMAFLVTDRLPPDYRPLASSWTLLFFPFLILSTLRLSPHVCTAAGLTGSVGYLLAAAHHGWHVKSDLLSNPVTHTAVPVFAVMICATGALAAVVAAEIRKHLVSALREAETERQLKQVEHDLSIARSIQQSLLPKVRPEIKGYEVAGWNRPADATGGDYFDWKQLQDGRVVVTLADVTGHGIGPALLASICRAYARANFRDVEPLPFVLQRINQAFGEDLLPGRFATFVAAVCQPDSDNVELLSAGHGPLFLYSHENGNLQKYAAHDVPLGILPHLTSTSAQVVSLLPGDMVFLITDGFLEWENPAGEQFGESRFEETVRATCHLSPEEIIAEMYAAVVKFAQGTPQQDDLTAVVIKRSAVANAKPLQATAATVIAASPF